MSHPTCKHPNGCPQLAHTAGWCSMHYQRVRRTGEPGPVGRVTGGAADGYPRERDQERIQSLAATLASILPPGFKPTTRVNFRIQWGTNHTGRGQVAIEVPTVHRTITHKLATTTVQAWMRRDWARACWVRGEHRLRILKAGAVAARAEIDRQKKAAAS